MKILSRIYFWLLLILTVVLLSGNTKAQALNYLFVNDGSLAGVPDKVIWYDAIKNIKMLGAETDSIYDWSTNAKHGAASDTLSTGQTLKWVFNNSTDSLDVDSVYNSVKSIIFRFKPGNDTTFICQLNDSAQVSLVGGTITLANIDSATIYIDGNDRTSSPVTATDVWADIVITTDSAVVSNDLILGADEEGDLLDAEVAFFILTSSKLSN